MIEDVRLADELHIFDISVVSGVRACGRTIDYNCCGRRNTGAALQAWQRLLPNGRP